MNGKQKSIDNKQEADKENEDYYHFYLDSA